MKIKTNLNKNTVTIMLDDGFKIILTLWWISRIKETNQQMWGARCLVN